MNLPISAELVTNPERPIQKGARRFSQLDSLRGIAALFVVFNHYALTVPEQVRQLADFPHGWMDPAAWATPWPWLRFTPLRLLVDGQAAVNVFFVLSGFVLALGVTAREQPAVAPFLIKRFCRVYVPFAATILLAAFAVSQLDVMSTPDWSRWLKHLYAEMQPFSLAGHLLMTGRQQDMVLDPAMWTLVHEMRVAFILPVIFLSMRRFGAVRTAVVCTVISLISSIGMTDSVSGSWQATFHYVWMFAVGSAVSFYRHNLVERVGSIPRWVFVALWLVAIALLIAHFDHVWSDFLMGSGASVVIVLSLRPGVAMRALVSPVPMWLGRVSYSLYLIHLPILMIAVGGGIMPPIASFLLTMVLAELAFRTIEAPSHKLGIWLSLAMRVPKAA